jgi:hypothetical protein
VTDHNSEMGERWPRDSAPAQMDAGPLFVRTFLRPPSPAALRPSAGISLAPLLCASHARHVAALLLRPPRWGVSVVPAEGRV